MTLWNVQVQCVSFLRTWSAKWIPLNCWQLLGRGVNSKNDIAIVCPANLWKSKRNPDLWWWIAWALPQSLVRCLARGRHSGNVDRMGLLRGLGLALLSNWAVECETHGVQTLRCFRVAGRSWFIHDYKSWYVFSMPLIYIQIHIIYIYISGWYLYLVFWSPVYFVIEKDKAYLWSPKAGDIYSLPLKFSFNLRSDYLDFGYSMKSKCELTISSVNWCAYVKDDLSFCLMCLGYQCCLRILQWLFLFGLTKLFICWTAEFIVFWFWWWSEVAQSCPTLCPTPWTAAHQAPLSMGFSRQEYWNGLLFPSPGDLPDPGIKPGSPALYADSLLFEPPGKSVKFDDEISW